MKLQQKVVIYPLLAMVVAFVVCLFGMEYQLKPIWQEQANKELSNLTNSSLRSIRYMQPQLTPAKEHLILDEFVSDASANSNLRLSIYNANQHLVADSQLATDKLPLKQSYKGKELTAASANNSTLIFRYSEFWQQEAVFYAQYDVNNGYTAVVSMPLNQYQKSIVKLRVTFFIVAIIIGCLLIALGRFISTLLKRTIEKEREQQSVRIEQKTREITLIQTMTTMLNAAKNYDEAGQVVMGLMPRLLPQLSGKLYLVNDNDKLDELSKWGGIFDSNITIMAQRCRERLPTKVYTKSNAQIACDSAICSVSKHLICVDLVDGHELFGVIHFLGERHVVHDKKIREVVVQLSEQVSLGLANLRVKNLLRQQAIRDPLTNLYNRRFMMEGFEQVRNRAERHGLSLAVLLIDLDHFKYFNDTYGHKAGDLILMQVASLFRDNIRMEDIACRYGGEEFCIICPDTGLKDGFALAEKLRVGINRLTVINPETDTAMSKVSISVGVAIYPNHGTTTQQLLINADKALYNAKNRGRNTTVVANQLQATQSN